MEELKLRLNAESIYNREFTGNKAGYDCLQVDALLDVVIDDYNTFTKFADNAKLKIEELTRFNTLLSEKVANLERENHYLNKKLSDLSSVEGVNYTDENLELLKRISKLEEALHALGGDPNKID